MRVRWILLSVSLFLVAGSALAQSVPVRVGGDYTVSSAPYATRPSHDVHFESNLFPPELVMAHQQALALEPEQKAYLRKEVRDAQGRFTDLQWELQDAMEGLNALLKEERVNEQPLLAQLDKVLEAERQIKRAQMSLMVRIKNKLTVEQRARLRDLRPQPRHAPSPTRDYRRID